MSSSARWKGFLKLAGLAVLLFAVVAATVLFAVYEELKPTNEERTNSLLFHDTVIAEYPDYLQKVCGIDGKQVAFKASHSGNQLYGWLYRNPASDTVVLFSHGNGGNIADCFGIVYGIVKSGVSAFAYDYSGYGKSEGSASVSGIVDDALSAYDYLRDKEGYDESSIILYGQSLGGGVTGELARKRKCRAIILGSTFTSPERLARHLLPLIYNLYTSDQWFSPRLDNLEFVENSSTPLLVIVPGRDGIIPPSQGKELFKRARAKDKQMVYLPRSSHCKYDGDYAEFNRVLGEFIKKHSRPVAGTTGEEPFHKE